ncbi:hypothetical protein APHAL10511_005804 [Amanita phalloides]|nr:hypothetical protein APHAL10511_005804 [Amanita phalloides]
MPTRPGSPPSKRLRLEVSPPVTPMPVLSGEDIAEDENHCSICLQEFDDQTVIPNCSHEFCFECLLIWTHQSRRCPLCAQSIGEYLIHNIRSKLDFSKHYLAPLRTSPIAQASPDFMTDLVPTTRIAWLRRRARERESERRRREREELDELDRLERSILKRRWIYRHHLYAKHVASNTFTRYKPYPSPAQFSASQDTMSRTTTFIRRELQVWPNLDVEFLTTFTISIMKAIDIRSESAVKLLAEFLDMHSPYIEGCRHVNAEHFAHEVYCFVRSPYRDLFVYDEAVQYDVPSDVPPPPDYRQNLRRWRRGLSPRSVSPYRTLSSHSRSRSPLSTPASPCGGPCSRTDHDSPKSPRTRSPSNTYRTRESGQYHKSINPDSSFNQKVTNGSRLSQQVPGSCSLRRDGHASEFIDTATESLPRGTAEGSLLIASTCGQPSSPQENEGVVESHNTLRHRKGTERVHDAKQLVTSSINEEGNDGTSLHLSSHTQSRAATHRLHRHRSFRESVEAHLGSGKRMRPALSDNVNAIHKNGELHADNSVSLLSAIQKASNCDTQNNGTSCIVTKNDIKNSGHDTHLLSSAWSSQQGTFAEYNTDTSTNREQSGISHASVTDPRMVAPQDTAKPPLATSPACDKNSGALTTDIDPMGISRQNHSSNSVDASHLSQSQSAGPRSRLLSRLRKEKDLAYIASAGGGKTSGPAIDHHAVDYHLAEKQLRRRAQLRMRLATEKRVVLGDVSSQPDEGQA